MTRVDILSLCDTRRYIVCTGYQRKAGLQVFEHLYGANLKFEKLEQDNQLDESDVMDLVPLSVLTECSPFFDYLKESNDRSAFNNACTLH